MLFWHLIKTSAEDDQLAVTDVKYKAWDLNVGADCVLSSQLTPDGSRVTQVLLHKTQTISSVLSRYARA